MEDISDLKKTSLEMSEPGLDASGESFTRPRKNISSENDDKSEEYCDDCSCNSENKASCASVKAVTNMCCKTVEKGEKKEENEIPTKNCDDTCKPSGACETCLCCCSGDNPNPGSSPQDQKIDCLINHSSATVICNCSGSEGGCCCDNIGGTKTCCSILRTEVSPATSTKYNSCRCTAGLLNSACRCSKNAGKSPFELGDCKDRSGFCCSGDGVKHINKKRGPLCCAKLKLRLNSRYCRSNSECCYSLDNFVTPQICYFVTACCIDKCECRCSNPTANCCQVSEGCVCSSNSDPMKACCQNSAACDQVANTENNKREVESSNTCCGERDAISACCKVTGGNNRKGPISCYFILTKRTRADFCFGGCSCRFSLSQCCSASKKMVCFKRSNVENVRFQNRKLAEKLSLGNCSCSNVRDGSSSKDTRVRNGCCQKTGDAPTLCIGNCSCCQSKNCCSKALGCCCQGRRARKSCCLVDVGESCCVKTGMTTRYSGKRRSCCSKVENTGCNGTSGNENCPCKCSCNTIGDSLKSSLCGKNLAGRVTFQGRICSMLQS